MQQTEQPVAVITVIHSGRSLLYQDKATSLHFVPIPCSQNTRNRKHTQFGT